MKSIMAKSIFEEMGGTYRQEGDYLIPNITLSEQQPIGIWGQRHLRYIKKHRKAYYTGLLLGGNLNSYLAEIDTRAKEMFDRLTQQMAEKQGITEELKAQDQMAWVGAMNNIRNTAEEIVIAEVIFA